MEETKTLPMRRIVVDPARAPEAIHHFVWARSGQEFLLEVGYIDFLEIHHKNLAFSRGEEIEPIDFVVTHRFSLSFDSLNKLAETVTKMLASLPEREEVGTDSND